MKFILAKKVGMTTIYQEGKAENVTLLEVGKNVITGIRKQEQDGYCAAVVGMVKEEKEGKTIFSAKREFRLDDLAGLEVGGEIKADSFASGDWIKLQGTTKGKGHQGVMRRHGFHGAPASHGHPHDKRAPGSIGCAFPERVFRGKKMAGRMGGLKATSQGLKVVLADGSRGLLAVRGAVPGNAGTLVKVVSVKHK